MRILGSRAQPAKRDRRRLLRVAMAAGACLLAAGGRVFAADAPTFPYNLPDLRPDLPLSPAMQRPCDRYPARMPDRSELFSTFNYTLLESFDYRGGDGTVSRRDPSKVIRVNGRSYVWYTRRDTRVPSRGPGQGTEDAPSSDCALSQDASDETMKRTEIFLSHDVFFSQGLTKRQRERIEAEARKESR